MLNGLSNVPVNAIDSYLSDVEDNITNSRLSLKEQAPLLMATLVGRKSYAYWISKTTTPGDWSGYFNANRAINFANIPYWVSASVQGALLAATRNDNADKPQNVSIDPAHALASSLAVAASRVMLNYISRRPKIHFELAKLETERLNEIFGGNRINQVEETGNGGEDSGRWKPKPKPTATCKLGLGKDWGCCGNYKGC